MLFDTLILDFFRLVSFYLFAHCLEKNIEAKKIRLTLISNYTPILPMESNIARKFLTRALQFSSNSTSIINMILHE